VIFDKWQWVKSNRNLFLNEIFSHIPQILSCGIFIFCILKAFEVVLPQLSCKATSQSSQAKLESAKARQMANGFELVAWLGPDWLWLVSSSSHDLTTTGNFYRFFISLKLPCTA
jgi:hypothetical protein